MAVPHISYNHNTEHSRLLSSGLSQLEDALDSLNEIKGTMALMIDGDGSSPTHFVYMREKFGFLDTDVSKSAWDELNSLLFKLNTNQAVTDVSAALAQAFNKFR